MTPSAPSPSGASGQRHLHALRPARGARAVEHVLALDPVLGRAAWAAGRRGRSRSDRSRRSTPSIISRTSTRGIWSRQLGGLLGLVGGGHEGLGAAVVDDVGHLLGREPGAHRGVVEAGVVRAPDHREEAGRVLEAQGDVVALLQAGGSEHVREPVGLGVELGVGDDLAGGGHDHGRPVGSGGGEGLPGTWRQGSRRYRGTVRDDPTARFAALVASPGRLVAARRGPAAHRRARPRRPRRRRRASAVSTPSPPG